MYVHSLRGFGAAGSSPDLLYRLGTGVSANLAVAPPKRLSSRTVRFGRLAQRGVKCAENEPFWRTGNFIAEYAVPTVVKNANMMSGQRELVPLGLRASATRSVH